MTAILITGACGEIGHALVDELLKQESNTIIAFDLKEMPSNNPRLISVTGDIRDQKTLDKLFSQYDFKKIFHLAAILSTGGERNPHLTHEVNVDGSAYLLKLAQEQTEKRGSPTIFIFPSTIAAYGIKSLAEKNAAKAITEDQYLDPITVYGVNKIYVEKLGKYYADNYKYLDSDANTLRLDFRSVRFPGIMSSQTVPSGGTSDYGPEMIHAAAKGEEYTCFVNKDSKIPFMVMPDAVKSLLDLAAADAKNLKQRVYNVNAFAVTAGEIEQELKKYFPSLIVHYKPHQKRLSIVESWPADVVDKAARNDWGWNPEYGFSAAFEKYLVPGITERYSDGNFDKVVGC